MEYLLIAIAGIIFGVAAAPLSTSNGCRILHRVASAAAFYNRFGLANESGVARCLAWRKYQLLLHLELDDHSGAGRKRSETREHQAELDHELSLAFANGFGRVAMKVVRINDPTELYKKLQGS